MLRVRERLGSLRRAEQAGERLSPVRHGEPNMAKSTNKVTLSRSRDIPFNRLVLSQRNVRRIQAGVSAHPRH
jgi:hypothetical protein